MKKTVSFLIAIIMTILCVPTGMAADSTRFKGNEITNNEILKTMVCLGVDERSEAAKQVHIVPDVKSTADNSVEIHQATRLINKVEKADGAIEEEYETIVMAATRTESDTELVGDDNVYVYVKITWRVVTDEITIDHYSFTKSEHWFATNYSYNVEGLYAWHTQYINSALFYPKEAGYAYPTANHMYTLNATSGNELTVDGGIGAGTVIQTTAGAFEVDVTYHTYD